MMCVPTSIRLDGRRINTMSVLLFTVPKTPGIPILYSHHTISFISNQILLHTNIMYIIMVYRLKEHDQYKRIDIYRSTVKY